MRNTMREKISNVTLIIRNIFLALGFLGIFIFGSIIDTEGPAYKYIMLGFILSLVSMGVAMFLEYFTFKYILRDETYRLVENLDDYYEDDDELMDAYYEWLKENNYEDSDDAYDYFCDYVA